MFPDTFIALLNDLVYNNKCSNYHFSNLIITTKILKNKRNYVSLKFLNKEALLDYQHVYRQILKDLEIKPILICTEYYKISFVFV